MISARRSRPGARWCGRTCSARVALMSAPFAGPPSLPSTDGDRRARRASTCTPRWRRWSGRASTTTGTIRRARPNDDMWHCPQGVHAFLRAYYHFKSADWTRNQPVPARRPGPPRSWRSCRPTTSWTWRQGMAETVAPEMPSRGGDRRLPVAARRRARRLQPTNIARTGFQGGLQWYRCRTDGAFEAELQLFSGRTIDVPSMLHRRQRATGASTRRRARWSAMQASGLHADGRRATWSKAPATGCSRSSPSRSSTCC